MVRKQLTIPQEGPEVELSIRVGQASLTLVNSLQYSKAPMA